MKTILPALKIMGLCTGALLAATPAPAADWPVKPVKIVVTFPPGGSADALARILGSNFEKELGQPFIVENKAGAGGSIGTAYAAKAEPDGYTLLIAAGGSLVVNPLISHQSYDTLKDLAPIAQLVSSPFALAISTQALPGVSSLDGLIKHAKAHPGLTFGSGGNGTQMHLAGELFNLLTKADLGHVPVAVVDLATIVPHLKSDRIKVVAISSPRRSQLAPQAPSATEAGLPDWQATGWIALLAPAGTPSAIVKRLEALAGAAVRSPDVAARILASGNEPAPSTSEEFRTFIQDETKRWRYVVDKVGIKGQ